MGDNEATASISARPALRLVQAGGAPQPAWAWFCGHCAAPPRGGEPPAPGARVCSTCQMGLLLEAPEDAVPKPGDPFMVLDSRMTVQAVSMEAERLLGTEESLAINRPVTELLIPAMAEGDGTQRFADAVAVTLHEGDTTGLFVRPWNTYGVRLGARIAACGPPRAALIVLQGPAAQLRPLGD